MIDFILILFMLAIWGFGFWCGKRFGSITEMFNRIGKWFDRSQ